jgi:hypothetical protein
MLNDRAVAALVEAIADPATYGPPQARAILMRLSSLGFVVVPSTPLQCPSTPADRVTAAMERIATSMEYQVAEHEGYKAERQANAARYEAEAALRQQVNDAMPAQTDPLERLLGTVDKMFRKMNDEAEE